MILLLTRIRKKDKEHNGDKNHKRLKKDWETKAKYKEEKLQKLSKKYF